MQSDDPAGTALDGLESRASAFLSAVRLTADQLRRYLADHPRPGTAAAREEATLGRFAAGRINLDRFAAFSGRDGHADGGWEIPVTRALEVLTDIEGRGDDLFRIRVERGHDLQSAVEAALADAGRAFGAARLAGLARSSSYTGEHDEALLSPFPFRSWSRAERRLAPPLVIEVAGEDLLASGLGTYLDGCQSLTLVVEGPSPPAPLARLLSPGVFVMQTDDPEALALPEAVTGPSIMALVPSEAALFVHTPEGRSPAHLELSHKPARAPRRAVGSISAFQQQQDLRLLLAAVSAGSPKPTPPREVTAETNGVPTDEAQPGSVLDFPQLPGVDPVDSLAAWLLSQADLSDLEEARF